MSGAAAKWIWDKIKEHPFTIGEKFVLSALSDEAGSDGIFYISHKRLADKCGLDRDYVRRTFRLFRSKQLVEVYAWKRDDGSTASNGYRLALDLPPEELKDVVRRFKEEGNRWGRFAGLIDKRGGVCTDPLPGPGGPLLWSERTTSPYPGDPLPGPHNPQRGSARAGGEGVRGDPPYPDPIPIPDGKPLTVSIPISSGRGKLVGGGAGAEYFRSIQSLLTQLPGVQVNVLNPRLVGQLYRRAVPFSIITAACWLSVARAQKGPDDFTQIKSFRYFQPCIEEILQSADKAILRQAAFYRLKLLGDAATEEDRQAFEALYGK